MTKKKKKVYWKSEWISAKEHIPQEGILVLTRSDIKKPKEDDLKGNINQFSDGNWFHLYVDKDVEWWRVFTIEDLTFYQDLAVRVFFENLTKDSYKGWDLNKMYSFDFEKLRSWINNRPQS